MVKQRLHCSFYPENGFFTFNDKVMAKCLINISTVFTRRFQFLVERLLLYECNQIAPVISIERDIEQAFNTRILSLFIMLEHGILSNV